MKGKELKNADIAFYKKVWSINEDWKGGNECEECGKYLQGYSATYISHIISRGAETRLRHDIRNTNILCYQHHQQWETGERKTMKIFANNELIAQELRESLIS